MNPSRIFILRPVGTSLLMVAIMLVGIVAYRFLPLSALPEVDYPTIQVQTFYPGASPDVMTSSGHRAARGAVRADAGPQPDVVDELRRRLGHHAAVQPESEPRHRRAGSAGGDQRRRQPAALRPAGAADLRQGQSRGRADPDARHHLQDPAAHAARGPRRHAPRAEDLAARRASGSSASAAASAGGAHRRQLRALAAYGLNIDDLRTTIANANVNTPKGTLRRPVALLHDQRQRSDRRAAEDYESIIVAYKNGDPVRLSDVAQVVERRRERLARRLGEQHPGDHPQHPAPAGRQRDPGGRRHQDAPALAQGLAARRRSTSPCSPTAPSPSAPRCTTSSSS